jgi:two-component system cell cycle response regulator DivK
MSPSRVLLVEDNIDNFELVKLLLERAGHQVLGARNGQQALELARQEHPDLILMDLSLPGLDGWAAGRKLKDDPQTASIPLFALTAHTLPGDRKRALESGYDGFISKPIDLKAFPDKIAKALQAGDKNNKG